MWKLLKQVFAASRRRTQQRHQVDVLESREMLSANIATSITSDMSIAFRIGLEAETGVSMEQAGKLTIYADSLKSGSTVARAVGILGLNGTSPFSLSNNRGGVFKLSGNEVQIAREQPLRPGTRHSVTVTLPSLNGGTQVIQLELIVVDTSLKITTPENASAGQVIGQLPRQLRRDRVQIREVAGDYTRWMSPEFPPGMITISYFYEETFSGISQPIQIGNQGQIVANPSSDPRAVRQGSDVRLDFESTFMGVSGRTLYEVRHPGGRTETLLVTLALENVKESSTISDQEAHFWYGDGAQLYTTVRERPVTAQQSLRIIGGNAQPWFSIVDSGENHEFRFRVRVSDLAGLEAFLATTDTRELELIVALDEDGQQVDTARIRIGPFVYTL